MAYINLGPTTSQEYRRWLKVYQEAIASHEKELSVKKNLIYDLEMDTDKGQTLARCLSSKEIEILSDLLSTSIAKQEASRDKCQEMVDEIQTYLNNLAQAESEEE